VIVDEIFGASSGLSPVWGYVLIPFVDGKQVPGMLMAQGIPVGRPPVVELRNMHATYAATWYVPPPSPHTVTHASMS
jgi:surfeit locus 1 family protein